MSDSTGYDELLDATLAQLRQMKSRGVRYVPVQPETWQALGCPAPQSRSTPTPLVDQVPESSITPSARVQVQVAPAPTPEPVVKPPAPLDVSSMPVMTGDEKARAFDELRARALVCAKCPPLASSRKNVVFGVGSIDAPLMFVGEAPGADEDAQGEPFVGKAGELLSKIIQAMGLQREDVYIANILKCRPDTPGQRSGNRKPTLDEMKTCIPYLHGQIDLIRPRVLVALGATAVEGLLGKTQGITRLRGNWQTYRDIPLMPTYHPAYLLRNQTPAEKRKVWEDMLAVMERLDMPISEKQRGYFLKAT